jgi:hypothetical protein
MWPWRLKIIEWPLLTWQEKANERDKLKLAGKQVETIETETIETETETETTETETETVETIETFSN